MQYYGTRLSENISKREPEGYLLCLNVPVARTGIQEYWPEEIGRPPGGGMIPVHRPEEEVFSQETIASFEGMPVTNDHPADGVDIDNIRRLQMGHAHNVRRGSGEEADLLMADLMITDPRLIEAILGGKREISCGYTYELHEENGEFIQRKIRGNHIAVVDAGRAGKRVSIRDHEGRAKDLSERRGNGMKKFTKVLARMARDGDAETVAEILEELMGEEHEDAEESGAPAAVAVATAEPADADDPAAGAEAAGVEAIVSRLDRIIGTQEKIIETQDRLIELQERLAELQERLAETQEKIHALLTPEAGDADPCGKETPEDGTDEIDGETDTELAEEVAEAIEEAVASEDPERVDAAEELSEAIEAILEPEVSTTVEETTEEEGREGSDSLREALRAIQPALARMPKDQRRKVCGDLAARLRKKGTDGGVYAGLVAAARKGYGDQRELGKAIMAKRNPNYRGD